MAKGVLLAEISVVVEFSGSVPRDVYRTAAESLRIDLRRHFDHRGAADLVVIDVEVSPGSLKGRLQVTMLALGAWFVSYGSVRESIDYAVSDAAYVADLGYRLANHVANPREVQLTRHDGPVLAINSVLERYAAGTIDRSSANLEIERQLSLITDAEDREAMLWALFELLDHRNPLLFPRLPPYTPPPKRPDPPRDFGLPPRRPDDDDQSPPSPHRGRGRKRRP